MESRAFRASVGRYSSLSVLGTARHDRVFYKVMSPGGLLVTGYENLPGATVHDDTPVFLNAVYSDAPMRIAVTGRFISGVARSGWVTVVVAQTRESLDLLASRLIANSFAPIAFAVVVGALLLWVGVRQALAPLSFLGALIHARHPQDFTPIDAPVPAEVGQLLAAINQLMVRFKSNLDSTQSFLADAAHQIRTPLAALRFQAELARREADVERLRNRVERIGRNAVEASELTTQLYGGANPIDVQVRPGTADHGPLVEIADPGPGVPDGEKSKVFERFSRGRLSKGIAGSGLGLSIAAAVAEAHHAALSLLDRPGGGLIVRLEFPAPERPGEGAASIGPDRKPLLPLILLLLLPALLLPLVRPALALEPVVYPAPAPATGHLRPGASSITCSPNTGRR